MQFKLIDGQFSPNEALEILSQMLQVKLRFHESKINKDSTEEDIKYRESRMKQLQAEWALVRNKLLQQDVRSKLSAEIFVQIN
jgi:hypothetical protein